MKICRKVFVVTTLLVLTLSLMAVNAQPGEATIHVQTYGYEGRDASKLKVVIAGEDSDARYFELNPGMLNQVQKGKNNIH